jgi:hypothetical protein
MVARYRLKSEYRMSSARVYVPAGTLTLEKRRAIVKGIHETINRVEQRPANAQTPTYVKIGAATGMSIAPRLSQLERTLDDLAGDHQLLSNKISGWIE